MKIKFEKHDWAGSEAYRISADDGDDETIGFVRRIGPDTWRFITGTKFDPHAEGPALKAETAKELQEIIAERFHKISLPGNRLTSERMHELVSDMLGMLAALARQSNSRPGYITAITDAIARVVVRDIGPDGEASFLDSMNKELLKAIATHRQVADTHKTFAATFIEMLTRVIDDDGDAPEKPMH